MKPTIKTIIYSALALACVALNAQGFLTHAQAKTSNQNVEVSMAAVSAKHSVTGETLRVLPLVTPQVIESSTLQQTTSLLFAQPSTISLQQTSENNFTQDLADQVSTTVAQFASVFVLNISTVAQTINVPMLAEQVPQHVPALPVSGESFTLASENKTPNTFAFANQNILNSYVSKGFAVPDLTIVLRC